MTQYLMLRRIGLWSATKTGFIVSAALGLIMGFFWGLAFVFFASLLASAASLRDPGIGAGAVVVMPALGALACGALGAVVSFLAALMYNLAAGVFGGLEFEMEGAEATARPGKECAPVSAPVVKPARRIWKQPHAGLALRWRKSARKS